MVVDPDPMHVHVAHPLDDVHTAGDHERVERAVDDLDRYVKAGHIADDGLRLDAVLHGLHERIPIVFGDLEHVFDGQQPADNRSVADREVLVLADVLVGGNVGRHPRAHPAIADGRRCDIDGRADQHQFRHPRLVKARVPCRNQCPERVPDQDKWRREIERFDRLMQILHVLFERVLGVWWCGRPAESEDVDRDAAMSCGKQRHQLLEGHRR